jgi:hypothetical protein
MLILSPLTGVTKNNNDLRSGSSDDIPYGILDLAIDLLALGSGEWNLITHNLMTDHDG